MRRIAVGLLAVVLGTAGCASRPEARLGPLPDPVLATRSAPSTIRAIPRPRLVKPPPTQPAPRASVRESTPASWTPPGGIQRGRWNAIVVHHSAADKATPTSMDRYHHQRGWANGLGYHFVIGNGVNFPDGQIHVGPRWNKQQTGAHCKSKGGRFFDVWRPQNYFNEHGIGICLIGDFEKARPSRKQLAALNKLVKFLCQQTGIPPDRIHGHGEVTHKTLCPGRLVNMDSVRRAARSALAAEGSTGRSGSPMGR